MRLNPDGGSPGSQLRLSHPPLLKYQDKMCKIQILKTEKMDFLPNMR